MESSVFFPNVFYSIILPLIGLLVSTSVLFFGGYIFSSEKIKELKEESKTEIILTPFKEAPWWTWIVSLLVMAPFIVHTLELWDIGNIHIREIVDGIWMLVVLIYFLVCWIAFYKKSKKEK